MTVIFEYTKFLLIFIKLQNHIKFKGPYYKGILDIYGISQDPNTKEYILVMRYANNGSLRDYLTKKFKDLKWKDKIRMLYNIILGLNNIHREQLTFTVVIFYILSGYPYLSK